MDTRKNHLVVYLAALLLLALNFGCSSTPYQTKTRDDLGGYASREFPDGTIQTSFEAPSVRDEQRYSDYALLRAAEITANSGMKYFTVVDRSAKKIEKKIRTNGSPRTEKVTVTRPNGTSYERTVANPSARPAGFIYETWQRCTVSFLPMPSPEGLDISADNVFEAASTIRRLKTKYRL